MNPHPAQLTIEEILIRGADPSERKHGGNENSVAAHARVVHTKEQTYKRIMEVLAKRPQTSKEIASVLNVPLHHISGRLSESKQLGWIEETGDRRLGAAVLRAVKPIADFEMIACPKCTEQIVAANMAHCYVCEIAQKMCGSCLDAHMKTHSEAELDAALILD